MRGDLCKSFENVFHITEDLTVTVRWERGVLTFDGPEMPEKYPEQDTPLMDEESYQFLRHAREDWSNYQCHRAWIVESLRELPGELREWDREEYAR